MPIYKTKPVYPAPACPPGLEATQGPDARPPPYAPVHFGGTREYVDDEDGFVVVTYGGRKKVRRNWKGKDKKKDKSTVTV